VKHGYLQSCENLDTPSLKDHVDAEFAGLGSEFTHLGENVIPFGVLRSISSQASAEHNTTRDASMTFCPSHLRPVQELIDAFGHIRLTSFRSARRLEQRDTRIACDVSNRMT
jgi:hypothetical protein